MSNRSAVGQWGKSVRTHFALGTVLLLVIAMLTGCEGHTKESLNAEGQALFQEGNYNGAIIHYRNALEKDPNFVEARYNLGLAYIETAKFEHAEREFQKVLLQNPYDKRVRLHLGRIANHQNKPEVAVPLLEKYLEDHPADATALEQLAYSATISGDLARAKTYLEKALAAEPDRISAKLALVHTFMSQGDRAKAREVVEALLKDHPNHRGGLHALAQLETQDRDTEGMLDAYTRITSIYPGDLFAKYRQGSLLADKGDLETVRASAASMVKEYPNRAEGHRLMGLVNFREGKYEDAILSLQKSIRIQPDLEAFYMLGMANYQVGNLEMAVTHLQTVLDYSPEFTQARAMLGEIFLRQRRAPEALAAAQRLIESAPADYRGYALKADGLMLRGEHKAAVIELSRASELAPTHYGLLLKLGLLKISQGDDAGEQDLLRAVKLSPQGVDARLALHTHYIRNRRHAAAIAVLEDGISGGKSDAVLYNALAKDALGRRDMASCEAYLAKAREANPEFLQTYYNAAAYHLSQGRPDETLAQYDQVLTMRPEDVRSLIGSSSVLEMQGKKDEARDRLARARATGDLGSALILAAFLQKHGQSDEALAILDEEAHMRPGNLAVVEAKARLHMARKEVDRAMVYFGQLETANPWGGTLERTRAWMSVGELDKAEESARRLIQLEPKRAASYIPLAGILEARHDLNGVEDTLAKAVAAEPGNTQIGMAVGEFHLRNRRLDKANQAFEAVLAVEPDNAGALTGKGMVNQLRNDRDKAVEYYLQAIQAKPDHAPALNNLAMLYAEDEETRLIAMNLAMAAFTQAGNDPSVIDTLGYVLIRNKRPQDALRVLERAKALAPGNPVIKYHIALAYADLDRRQEAVEMLEVALAASEFEGRMKAEQLMRTLRTQ